jgi:hypothetical protein
MAKSELTLKLEREIWEATHKQGVFCCFEVTIGWFGKERVDYMTYDTKGVFRCYEIKVSKADFHSRASKTFVGHYNYYVMTKELFDQVWNEVPQEIGIYVGNFCAKRAKRVVPPTDIQILKDSLIRSLSREVEKSIKSGIPSQIESLNRKANGYKNERDNYYEQYWNLKRKIEAKYGIRWDRE